MVEKQQLKLTLEEKTEKQEENINTLQQQLQQRRHQLDELNKNLQHDRDMQHRDFVRLTEQKQRQIDNQELKVEPLEEQIQQLQADLEAEFNTFEELNQRHADEQSAAIATKVQRDKFLSELRYLNQLNLKAQNNVKEAENKKKSNFEQLTAIDKQIAHVRAESDALEAEIQRKMEQLFAENEALSELKAQRQIEEVHIAELEKKLRQATENHQRQHENVVLQEKTRLLAQFRQLEAQYEKEEGDKKSLQQELADKADLDRLQTWQHLMAQENKQLSAQKQKIQSQLHKMKQQEQHKKLRENFLEEQMKAVLNGHRLK